MEDAAGVLVAEVVRPRALPQAQGHAAWSRASSGVNGSAWRLVKMLSRPNMVMNQGSPAAGRQWPGSDTGENRSAARSTRLR